MEEKLYEAFEQMSEREAEQLNQTLEGIADGSKASHSTRSRIRQLTMKKAGIHTNNRYAKAHSRRLVATVAAAALLIVGGGGAAAAGIIFTNRESIDTEFGDGAAQVLEEKGAVANIMSENEHFRVTADMITSDGVQSELFCTLIPLDEKAVSYITNESGDLLGGMPDLSVCYADDEDSQQIPIGGGANLQNYNETIEIGTPIVLRADIPLDEVDSSRKLKLCLSAMLDDEELMDGIEIEFNLNESLQEAVFESEDGSLLKLTPVTMSFSLDKQDVQIDHPESESLRVSYEKSDGSVTEEELLTNIISVDYDGDSYTYVVKMESVIEPDDYTTVIITDISGNVIAKYSLSENA